MSESYNVTHVTESYIVTHVTESYIVTHVTESYNVTNVDNNEYEDLASAVANPLQGIRP